MYTERMLHTVERTHTPHTNKDPVHSILFCFANVSSTIGAKMTTKKIYIYRMREQTQQFRTLIHSFNRLLGCCCCSIQTPKRSPRTHSKRHWKHSKSDDASSFHFFPVVNTPNPSVKTILFRLYALFGCCRRYTRLRQQCP